MSVLLGHLPVVCHLEHGLLHRSILRLGYECVDSLEGYLYAIAQANLRQVARNGRYGSQVQAEGKFTDIAP